MSSLLISAISATSSSPTENESGDAAQHGTLLTLLQSDHGTLRPSMRDLILLGTYLLASGSNADLLASGSNAYLLASGSNADELAAKRFLTVHADDAGMSHSFKRSSIEAMEYGVIEDSEIELSTWEQFHQRQVNAR